MSIDIKLLNKSEYTLAEIASIFHLEAGKVKNDIRRLKYPTRKKMIVQESSLGSARMRRKIAVNCLSKEYLLKYRKYLIASKR